MPLSDRFFCFEGGRIKQVTLTVRDLGTQNDMIRSLMRPAPFVLRDFTCLAYEAIRNKTASLGIYDPKTNTTKDTEVRLFGRRNPIIAASEQAIVGCFPIATLPLFTRLGPDHNPVADTPALTRVLLLKGSNVLDHPQLIETTVLLPMPPETWITFTANKAGAYWTLTAGTMEVYSAQGMRTPALVNVFDNGNICLGNLEGTEAHTWNKLVEIFFDRFFGSVWNDHLLKPTQDYWVRWTADGAYIPPTVGVTDYTRSTGTANSGYIAESYKHEPLA